jgi:hypothetical protein
MEDGEADILVEGVNRPTGVYGLFAGVGLEDVVGGRSVTVGVPIGILGLFVLLSVMF